jgi:membrane protein DedA with SNARE-associated domain
MFDVQMLGIWGLAAVYLGTVLEGEAVLLVAVLLVEQEVFSLQGIIVAGYLGAITGDLFCFWMGRRHGRYLLARWPSFGGRVMQVAELLKKHRIIVILGYRFVYGARSAVPAALGMSGISRIFFILLDLCAACAWILGITVLGRVCIRSMRVDNLLDSYQFAVAGIVFLVVSLWIARRYIHKRRLVCDRRHETR